jgi:glycosyltransferase involved in cell wall biosynthesis
VIEVKELPGATLRTLMRPPVLSIVVPAFNEAARIPRTINDIREEMNRLGGDIELIIVDDGSIDENFGDCCGRREIGCAGETRPCPTRGKGAAVRRGMVEARGTWRFLADADLSMPISELKRFLDAAARRATSSSVARSQWRATSRRAMVPSCDRAWCSIGR